MALNPERFRKELSKLSPRQAKKHLGDDRQLMRFLADLGVRSFIVHCVSFLVSSSDVRDNGSS